MDREIRGTRIDGKVWYRLADIQDVAKRDLAYLMKVNGIHPRLAEFGKRSFRVVDIDSIKRISEIMCAHHGEEKINGEKLAEVVNELAVKANEIVENVVEDNSTEGSDNVPQILNDIAPIDVNQDVQMFSNTEFGDVRVADIDGNPWFAAKDIATALGYKDTVSAIQDHVFHEDKLRWRIATPFQTREMIMINESGVYSLILSSKLPSARSFKRWLTSEVIPSIRKHGIYATEEVRKRLIEDPDFLMEVATGWKKNHDRMIELQAKVEEDAPKVAYATTVSENGDLISVEEFSKMVSGELGFDIGRNRLYEFMRTNRILRRKNNLPYQRYINEGYLKVVESIVPDGPATYRQVYITDAGRLWLFAKLASDYKQ